MSSKYKYAILIVVILAVFLIIGGSNLTLVSDHDDPGRDLAEDQFQPNENPYQDYTSALADGKPVVIEFYARF